MPPAEHPAAATGSHILLVTPLTFAYHEAISASLRRLGHQVTWWNDRAGSGTVYKLALRLLPALTRRLSAGHFLARVRALPSHGITQVLVVKAEGMSRPVIAALRARVGDVPLGFYLWDGVENVKGVTQIVDCFDAVASFDPVDAQRHGWHHRPLFSRFDDDATLPAMADKDIDWSFVGTLHSDRHRVIDRLRRSAPALRSFVFGFVPGRLMLLLRMALDRSLWRAPAGTLSTAPMAAADVQRIVARSRAVLDVEHPRQRGLTMRTIETLMAGHKLVTTNRHVVESDLYHPSRVLVVSRDDPLIPTVFLDRPFEPIDAALRHRYSCAGWAEELLMLARDAHWRRSSAQP